MRTISVSPGSCNRVLYTYKQPGQMRAVHLVCKTKVPRPPKGNHNGTGVGDRSWLMNTPFLTVDITDDSKEGQHKVLFAIDADADVKAVSERVLYDIGDHCIVAIPEEDADFVADGMRMPMVVITENKKKGFVAVYRKRHQ